MSMEYLRLEEIGLTNLNVCNYATSLVESVIPNLISNLDKENSGGYLVIGRGDMTGLITRKIGDSRDSGSEGYAIKKIEAMVRELPTNPNLISSWQVRNIDSGVYGGGIITRPRWAMGQKHHYRIAFSEFGNEHIDEAISIALANEFGLITPEQIERIIEVSQNKVYQEMQIAHDIMFERT